MNLMTVRRARSGRAGRRRGSQKPGTTADAAGRPAAWARAGETWAAEARPATPAMTATSESRRPCDAPHVLRRAGVPVVVRIHIPMHTLCRRRPARPDDL